MENGKWKKIAIVETALIAVVLVFAAGFFIGKGKRQEKGAEPEAGQETTAVQEEIMSTQAQEETATDQKQSFDVTPSENGLKISFDLTQDWGSEEEHFYSYTVVLENTGSDMVEDWAAKVPVSGDFAVSTSWNTVCGVSEDGYLYIEPVDFNKSVEAGAVLDSIGIIMTYQTEPDFANALIGFRTGENGGFTEQKETSAADKTQNSDTGKGGNVMTGYQGKLHVEGTHLTDEDGNIVQLRGISTHGIAWFPD